MRWVVRVAAAAIETAWMRALLVLTALAGTLFGFYYYLPQMNASPPWMWAFIPDSPTATLVYAIALISTSFGRRSSRLDALAFILMTKVGVWTTVVLLVYHDHYFLPDTLIFRGFILVSHLVMVGMAVLLLPGLRRETAWFYICLGTLLLALDVVDYAFGTHPWMPDAYLPEIAMFTYALTGCLVVIPPFALPGDAQSSSRPRSRPGQR